MYFGEPSIMPVCVIQLHDVRRLDVPVHHAVLVRVRESFGDLRRD
jgi:hypothetical protein